MITKKKHICIVLLSLIFVVVLSACGEKGPPLPPEVIGEKVFEPYDLKLTQTKDILFLTWDHRVDPVDAKIVPESFDVFMAVKDMETCDDCPFIFELAAIVPMPKMEFITRVEKGHKYYFRVQAVGEGDKRSEYSKTVQIEIK